MASAVMTDESRKQMTERLGPEYEVYNYVVQRLERQWLTCKQRETQQTIHGVHILIQ